MTGSHLVPSAAAARSAVVEFTAVPPDSFPTARRVSTEPSELGKGCMAIMVMVTKMLNGVPKGYGVLAPPRSPIRILPVIKSTRWG